jgi:hypothetical protein
MKMKTVISCIEFVDPNIKINWELKEGELVSFLKCEKSESRIYNFEAKLYPENIDVFSFVRFNDKGFKIDINVAQTNVEKVQGSKMIYIDENNTNILKEYLNTRLGSPNFFFKLFSILNKPFYIHRWTFKKLNITHKYQDSASGFYESLIFDVKY